MVVNLSDNAAFKYLADKEQYERDLLDTVLRLMVANESTLFIDVGANYGPFSLAAAHSWRGDTRRRVVAFEPDARPFAALMQSVRVNGFDPLMMVVNNAVANIQAARSYMSASGPLESNIRRRTQRPQVQRHATNHGNNARRLFPRRAVGRAVSRVED